MKSILILSCVCVCVCVCKNVFSLKMVQKEKQNTKNQPKKTIRETMNFGLTKIN